MTVRSKERVEFLADVLVTAIEHNGYGFSEVIGGGYDEKNPGESKYVIVDRYDEDDNTQWEVSIETIATGIGVIRNAELRVDGRYPADGKVLHNTKTAVRMYLPQELRALILRASDENDAGEIDVIGALAILECALFGHVMYA